MENPKEAEGRKKHQMHLMPPVALEKCVEVLEFGANKYGAYNWRKTSIKLDTYVSAIIRHINEVNKGYWLDEESGKPHIAHIMASCALVLDADEIGKLNREREDTKIYKSIKYRTAAFYCFHCCYYTKAGSARTNVPCSKCAGPTIKESPV